MPIQILLIAAILAIIWVTWKRAQQRAVSTASAAGWTVLWLAAAAVIYRPELASLLAEALGVGRGADAVVYLAVIALFYLVFRIFVRLERMERDITDVVRAVAISASGRDSDRK